MVDVGGRPSKLTDKLQTRICNMLRIGESVSAVCRAVGIDRGTFHRWVDAKRSPAGPEYREFRKRVKEARAQREKERKQ